MGLLLSTDSSLDFGFLSVLLLFFFFSLVFSLPLSGVDSGPDRRPEPGGRSSAKYPHTASRWASQWSKSWLKADRNTSKAFPWKAVLSWPICTSSPSLRHTRQRLQAQASRAPKGPASHIYEEPKLRCEYHISLSSLLTGASNQRLKASFFFHTPLQDQECHK